ncbi:MAG: nicotinamide-nucleotide amidohydrolase family protein [Betaproteobacteria bacterium]|jgi:nicotinamide-nucleotide amidase|nr:nicotinamide-nucleotide amidohydrolase family protein [Betaproteobacteria bacterium]
MSKQTGADDQALMQLAAQVGEALKAQGLMLATAESCTGGWIAQACTAVAGSSNWFERGFISYTYIAKREMLDVAQDTLGAHGAVSEPVVREMVAGALRNSHAQVAVAVSGTAGPGGGTPHKPVGTVCLAWGIKNGEPKSLVRHYAGDREAVRRQTVRDALQGLLDLLPHAPDKS